MFKSHKTLMLIVGVSIGIGCASGEGTDGIKASSFKGTWSGTYSMSGAQTAEDVPFRLDNIMGSDGLKAIAGSLESQNLTGAFAATLDENGVAVGEFENHADGTMWTATLTLVDGDIDMRLSTDAATVAGLASPQAPANGLNYKTSVKNTASEPLTLLFRTSSAGFDVQDVVTIQPGETFTDETGAWCPLGFSTNQNDVTSNNCTPVTPNPWSLANTPFPDTYLNSCVNFADITNPPPILSAFKLPNTNCWGKLKASKDFFWPCCRSSTWEIRANPVTFDGTTYPYSFTKM